MTNQQILQKVIEKAVENGWHRPKWTINAYGNRWVADIIFSHDFAKPFWGTALKQPEYYSEPLEAWQYHLRQMVLEKEPLKYLEGFLEE